MRKINLLLLVALGISLNSHGQYFTVKLGGGYSWPGIQQSTGVLTFQPGATTDPANSSIIPLQSYNTSSLTSDSNKYKSNVYGGYGQGGHIDFGFGYMINPYFGIQLDGAYLWGSNVSAVQLLDAGPTLGKGTTITTTTHSNGLSVNPSLVIRGAKPGALVAPYARLGLALPIAGAIYHHLDIKAPNSVLGNITSSQIDVKTEATVSLGFQGAVGVSITPVPLISVWAEMSGQYLFVKAKEATLTKYSLQRAGTDDVDLMASQKTYSLVTNFVDKIDQNSNTDEVGKKRDTSGGHDGQSGWVDESKPRDVLRQVANLGSFGFSVGVTFNMSKKIFKDPFGKKAKAKS